jgi:hypothetical protein
VELAVKDEDIQSAKGSGRGALNKLDAAGHHVLAGNRPGPNMAEDAGNFHLPRVNLRQERHVERGRGVDLSLEKRVVLQKLSLSPLGHRDDFLGGPKGNFSARVRLEAPEVATPAGLSENRNVVVFDTRTR